MVKFNFAGKDLSEEVIAGISEIAPDLGIVIDPKGMPVEIQNSEAGLSVTKEGHKAFIGFSKRVELYRALGLLIQHNDDECYHVEEQNTSEMLGTMVDNSRNAVLNVSSVKRLLRYMALMGHNTLMLYTEDTYEIEGYPYFGYMRGRFTSEELQECDEYAQLLGVELVPCIQTLAHLNAALRWKSFHEIRDCNDILLAGEEKTYALIDAMLSTMSKNLKSRKINIGMDEAEMLGLGTYLKKNGFKNRSEIMLNHLNRVVELCRKYGYKPMMWSDMFFKLAHSGNYYDSEGMPQEIIEKVPQEVSLIYWDYYSLQPEKSSKMLDKHLAFNNPCAFAGGAWRWSGFAPINAHSLISSRMILEQCRDKGVNNLLVTAWGDDGSECSMFTILPILQLFAESSYAQNMQDDHISERLKVCAGMSLKDFMLLDAPNNLPGNGQPGKWGVNPSKYMLYQDILMGLFDKHVEEKIFARYYAETSTLLSHAASRNTQWKGLFINLAHLCDVLEVKCDMGIRLKKSYDARDVEGMRAIAHQIPDLQRRIDVFYEDIRRQWMNENKPFGFDVISIRFGALKMRVDEALRRIEEYLSGDIDRLEELEQERLYYDARTDSNNSLHLDTNMWTHIVSPNVIAQNTL
jgi:hypothetical protein